uniref:Major facilitator superfamily (MFS) profile domain-containing protein n=1 Tax=Timema genevievae TaxID=629358 RepID=A0A7R9K2R9_TIMGE|nr:unnamed protein product [Timema genevievae]
MFDYALANAGYKISRFESLWARRLNLQHHRGKPLPGESCDIIHLAPSMNRIEDVIERAQGMVTGPLNFQLGGAWRPRDPEREASIRRKHVEHSSATVGDGLGPMYFFWRRRRYMVAMLAFFGFFNVYALRVNFSVAIVAMTSNRTVKENGTIVEYGPEFDWDSKTQGLLLSSFFFGYICTQILGGWLASRVGGNKVYGIGIAATSILTIVMPAVTYFPDHAVIPMIILVRVVEGLFEVTNSIENKWC